MLNLNDDIKKSLGIVPKKPGVYLFKDSNGKVIYVGKAKNLSDRIKTYFQAKDKSTYTTHPILFFTNRISSFDYIVTENEFEALMLESSLIKKNRPKYNILLKDDKSYPYIAITENEEFPRVIITRNKNIRGAKYYGPYINVRNLKDFFESVRKIFKIRDCKKPTPGKVKNSVCLNYHIDLCSAPCAGNISKEEYGQNIKFIRLLLKGKDRVITGILKDRMAAFSRSQEYEKAEQIKNQIHLIESLGVNQNIFFRGDDSWDVIACSHDRDGGIAAVSVFIYRLGELAVINNFIITNIIYPDVKEILSAFIKSYYFESGNLSPVIYLPVLIEDGKLIEEWFYREKGKKIKFKIPKKGSKKDILNMVHKNAKLYLEKKKFEKSSGFSKVFKQLSDLRDYLGLVNIPKRIECYDISNIGSDFAVGSMAVFFDGSPLRENYRHFRIRTITGQDDFAMIGEIISRRIRYLGKNDLNIEDSFYLKPDLIIIDGGKAQYNVAKKILSDKNIDNIDLISIAKRQETVFCRNFPEGLVLDRSLNHSKLIIKIRDEAHRFAISYHRKLRDKYMTNSVLDGIKGIGTVKKKNILEVYPTLEELRKASLEDFLNIKGLNYKDALSIYNSLNRY